MILAVDVHYKKSVAKAVGVLFQWDDEKPQEIIYSYRNEIADYESGQFYKRELPCILDLLQKTNLNTIGLIIVDGHVYVNNDKTYGLGGHLYESLEKKIPIIGVAKRSFIHTENVSYTVMRGESKNPLYISSIGIEPMLACQKIAYMKGKYRIPNILKILDSITKQD